MAAEVLLAAPTNPLAESNRMLPMTMGNQHRAKFVVDFADAVDEAGGNQRQACERESLQAAFLKFRKQRQVRQVYAALEFLFHLFFYNPLLQTSFNVKGSIHLPLGNVERN